MADPSDPSRQSWLHSPQARLAACVAATAVATVLAWVLLVGAAYVALAVLAFALWFATGIRGDVDAEMWRWIDREYVALHVLLVVAALLIGRRIWLALMRGRRELRP